MSDKKSVETKHNDNVESTVDSVGMVVDKGSKQVQIADENTKTPKKRKPRQKRIPPITIKNIDDDFKGEGAIICGIDEVGRGPLYGEVVSAAVILPDGFDITGIDDSKKLSEKKRDALSEKILNEAEVSFGVASAEEIDEVNILNATKLAMKRAIEGLSIKPTVLLIDAVKLDDIDIESHSFIKGDEKSASIAAASIVAKVKRDTELKQDGETYPEYGFESHKGYGTKKHVAAIKEHGVLPKHRKTFLKNILNK